MPIVPTRRLRTALKKARSRLMKRSLRARRPRLIRSICPNHLTVAQYCNIFNTQAGISSVGSAGNVCQVFNQSTVPLSFALAFRLDDIPQYATYQALFDQYQIRQVILHFSPILNSGDLHGATGAAGYPQVFLTTVDYDDATAPSSIDVVRDYQSSVERDMYKPFTVSVTPRAAVPAYAGAFSSFMPTTGYIDIAYPSVQHYGFKGVVNAGNTTYTQSWTITAQYIIDFKNIR